LKAQQLWINEIMSVNTSTVYDLDGETPDWIEIYNAGSDTINLSGYFLSDNYDNIKKWRFPQRRIYPGEYKLVFASVKDKTIQSEIHTNFSIDSDGEELILSDSNGVLIQRILPVKLSDDISFGSKPDESTEMVYFDQPSPGESNNNSLSHSRLQSVDFSVNGGIYENDFSLVLSHADPNAIILYTTDGSEPSLDNIPYKTYPYKNYYPVGAGEIPYDYVTDTMFTFVYHEPIRISEFTVTNNRNTNKSSTVQDANYFPEESVVKANVIRAKAVKFGMEDSECKTETYFYKKTIAKFLGLPIVSINCNSNDLFDYNKGIYTAGVDFDNWRLRNPYEETIWPIHGNFKRRGSENEIAVNIEYFIENCDSSVVNTLSGLRINGGETRSFPMKSLRLCPDVKYGDDKLNYKFFNKIEDTSFSFLVLRNSGNDFPTDLWEPASFSRTMIRDAYIQFICRNMNLETQAYQPVIVFLNGEFWGLHNLREKYDKEYFKRVCNIEYDDLEYLSDIGSVIEGANWHYNNLINYISIHGTESQQHYVHISEQMDIENYIDYMIAEIFVHNTDWPENNMMFWRKKTYYYEAGAEYGHDGRWRWIMSDTDLGFGLHDFSPDYQRNTIEYLMDEESTSFGNEPSSTYLFRNLIKNTEFKNLFLQKFEYHLMNTFNPSITVPIIDSLVENVEQVMPYHLERWTGDFYDIADWHHSIDQMKTFAILRPCEIREMLKEYFNIDSNNYAFGICENDIVADSDYCSCVKLYPNPVTDQIRIKFPDARYYSSEIRIYEITGKSVSAYDIYIFDTEVEINVENLSSGLYCVLIINGDKVCSLKFLKSEFKN